MMQQISSIQVRGDRPLKVRQVSELLLEKFMDHIGSKNSVTRDELFRWVYGHRYNSNSLADYYCSDVLRRAMHLARVKTNCFITIAKNVDDTYVYYIPQTEADIQGYIGILDQNIARMNKMKIRARRAVNERWWKNKFEFKTKMRG